MAKHRATFQGWCPFRGCLHRSESRPTSLERPGSINGWTRPERHRRPSDSSFRAGSRHTRDSCIRGAETAARLTRNALLRWSEIAEARGKTIHREVELHALIDDVNEWDNEHWKAMSPPAADGIRPLKPSRRSRRFRCSLLSRGGVFARGLVHGLEWLRGSTATRVGAGSVGDHPPGDRKSTRLNSSHVEI